MFLFACHYFMYVFHMFFCCFCIHSFFLEVFLDACITVSAHSPQDDLLNQLVHTCVLRCGVDYNM
jgi:hypothetical protein